MRLKRERYTKEQLARELGIPPEVIRKYFPAPHGPGSGKKPGRRAEPVWSARQVGSLLSDPDIRRVLDKAARSAGQAGRADDAESEKIRQYLKTFDISRMRDEARELKRWFIIHSGPTNSGKTYQALQSLKACGRGVYLGPLRLLALEVSDTLNKDGVPCSLLTGEESIEVWGAEHTASTIEMADCSKEYDVAVIDEAQMITDPNRGDRWMRAIYGIRAREVHLCLAPEAKMLICRILDGFGAAYTVIDHHRLAPLSYAGPFEDLRDAKRGDAFIVFSRKAVLSLSAELHQMGIEASVIYGALPPVSRREEVRRFTAGETDVVVATDAIGMGVSLPIGRIIFCETTKFDGKERRPLRTGEIKQVAGRAGRYGLYDRGEVLAMTDHQRVRAALNSTERAYARMTVPFPERALEAPWPLDRLLKEWDQLPNEPGLTRVDMNDALKLYRVLGKGARHIQRKLLYDLITCPLDTDNEGMVAYWLACVRAILRREDLPEPPSGFGSLEQCEDRYRELDIRHQLLRRIGIEEDRMDEKEELCRLINRFLQEDRALYLRRCTECGARLDITYPYRICEKCFRRNHSGRYRTR